MTTKRTWAVAHDFSEPASAALAQALDDLGAVGGGRLLLIHAIHVLPSPATIDLQVAYADVEAGAVVDAEQRLHGIVAGLKRTADAKGITLEVDVIRGPPLSVVDHAVKRGADKLIVGSHGRRGLARWALGSVSERMVRRSPISVLVVHARAPRQRRPLPPSAAAVERALEREQRERLPPGASDFAILGQRHYDEAAGEGFLVGMVAGVVAVVASGAASALLGLSALRPLRLLASVVGGAPMLDERGAAPVVLGLALALGLAGVAGAVFGIAGASQSDAQRASPARQAFMGALFGAALWFFGVWLAARAFVPWLVEQGQPFLQLLAFVVAFGVPLGALFAWLERRSLPLRQVA